MTLPHSDVVHSARFSPDGNKIVTGCRDNVARIWDVATGQVVHSLVGHSDWVWRATYSPDGSRISTAGRDGVIKLWDAVTGQLQQTLLGHMGDVGSAEFNANGTRLVSGANDATGRIWDITLATGDHDISDGRWTIYNTSAALPDLEAPKALLGSSYPNPASTAVTFDYEIPVAGYTRVYVTDLVGKTVMVLVNGVLKSDRYTANIDVSGFAPGIYFYTLEAPEFTVTKSMLIN
jgi:hypothetical protein